MAYSILGTRRASSCFAARLIPTRLRVELHQGEALQVWISGHENAADGLGHGVHERITRRESVGVGKLCGPPRETSVHREAVVTTHGRGECQRAFVTQFTERPAMHFELDDGRHDQRLGTLDVGGKPVRVRLVGEVGEPATGVEDDAAHGSR